MVDDDNLHFFSFQKPKTASVAKSHVAHGGGDYFLVLLLTHATPLLVTFEPPAKVGVNGDALGEVDRRLYD